MRPAAPPFQLSPGLPAKYFVILAMALTMQRASTARVAGRRVPMARAILRRGKFVVQAAKKSVGDLTKVLGRPVKSRT